MRGVGGSMSLTNKQRVFVAEYLTDFNATQAAIRAGYSQKTAYSIGQENLNKPEIKAAIEERIADRNEVLAGLTDIARGDMADLMAITTQGFTLQLMVKDPETGEMKINPNTKLIRKIKQKVTTYLAKKEDDEDREVIETEIELYSAHEAWRDLGKYHALFVDRSEVTGTIENYILEVKPVDYRNGLAALAPRSIPDSDAPGESEDSLNGAQVG